MKRIGLIISLVTIITIITAACTIQSNSKDALKFKEEYEALNGIVNSYGKPHRSVSIDSKNPFVYISADDIIEKINIGESFYVYFGSTLCPWCRSVIEKAIEIAKNNNIDKIYYVDIWDTDGNEILRDKYVLNDSGTLEKKIEGTTSYYQLLDQFSNVLADYTLTDSEGSVVEVGEKRIYAPNFVYIENGKAVKMTEGISSKQTDSRDVLSEEILKDEELLFKEFFEN